MELSSPNNKKVLTLSQKKAFLIFQEKELFKKTFLYFRKFPSSRNKKNLLLKSFLYFRKWKFLAPLKLNKTF